MDLFHMRDRTGVMSFKGSNSFEGLRKNAYNSVGTSEEDIIWARSSAGYICLLLEFSQDRVNDSTKAYICEQSTLFFGKVDLWYIEEPKCLPLHLISNMRERRPGAALQMSKPWLGLAVTQMEHPHYLPRWKSPPYM